MPGKVHIGEVMMIAVVVAISNDMIAVAATFILLRGQNAKLSKVAGRSVCRADYILRVHEHDDSRASLLGAVV
jgi:hypothetical protein